MALISSTTLITSVAIFHITLAYFFLARPSLIDDQTLVFIVGESMGIPKAQGFDTRNSPLGLVATILAFFSLSDLVSLSLPEEVALLYYWGTQAPFRFLFAMSGCLYIFFLGPASPFRISILAHSYERRQVAAEYSERSLDEGWGGDALKNRVVFTFLFVEMVAWFWIWTTLREERPAIIEKARRDTLHQHEE